MVISVRRILTVLGGAFALYLTVRSLVWVGGKPEYPVMMIVISVLYAGVAALCLFAGSRPSPSATREGGRDASAEAAVADASPGTAGSDTAAGEAARVAWERGAQPLARWVCALAVLTALVMPTAVMVAVGPETRTTTFGTWYIGGIGLLMTVVMARRRSWAAWLGTALLTAASMAWLEPLPALGLGLVGSLMWVTAAQLLVFSFDRAARDTQRLAQLQQSASAWRAAQSGRRRERRVQVQRALAVAGPILARTIEKAGVLDVAERAEARIAEGQLRDEMRGQHLLDDGVRAELDAARRRGATVTVFDEGGLDDLDASQLAAVRAQLARIVHDATSQRLYIRAPRDGRVAVTVVGRTPGPDGGSDEDSVDLWHEIPRP